MATFASAAAYLVSTNVAYALPFLPLTYSGSLGYNYSYVTSSGSESDLASLTANINASGYIWQPWFATLGLAYTLGLTRTETSDGSLSESTVTGGGVGLNIFPRSRFPFNLTYNVSDSRLDAAAATGSGVSKYRNERFLVRQSYYARAGWAADLTWNHTDFDSEIDEFISDNYGANFRLRRPAHNLVAITNLTTNERLGTNRIPETLVVTVNHNYTPSTDLGVNSLANHNVTKTDDPLTNAITTNSQLASFFSWRPQYRPFSLNGGVRISTSTAEDNTSTTDAESVNTNFGANYQFTRGLRVSANSVLGVTTADAVQTMQSTINTVVTYSSQQSVIVGFLYNWNANVGASYSVVKTDDVRNASDSVSSGLSHMASRSWAIGRGSTLRFGLSQSLNAAESVGSTVGVGHGLNLGWNQRGGSGSTYATVSLSDSRTFGDQDTIFQLLNTQFTRNQQLNRLSSLNGTASVQVSRQEVSATDTTTTSTGSATLGYTHSRVFGIYRMLFRGQLIHTRIQTEAATDSDITELSGSFDYRIGLLDASLTLRANQSSVGPVVKSLYFRATRMF